MSKTVRYELEFEAQEEVGLPFTLVNADSDDEAIDTASHAEKLREIAIKPRLLRKVTVEILKKW